MSLDARIDVGSPHKMSDMGEIALEDLPLFPAVYAFFICIFIVVGGIWLRKIAMRPEDYYDDE